MTQPAYRFMSGVGGLSSDGYLGLMNQHGAGEEPLATLFNNNTNILSAILANLDLRQRHMDGLNYGNNADEGIFDTVVSDFSNMLELLADIKGSGNTWYATMDGTKSLQDLYDRLTYSVLNITTAKIDNIEDYTGGGISVDDPITFTNTVNTTSSIQIGATGDTITKLAASEHSFGIQSNDNFTYDIAHGLGDIPDFYSVVLYINPAGTPIASQWADCAWFVQSVTSTYIRVRIVLDSEFRSGQVNQATIKLSWIAGTN